MSLLKIDKRYEIIPENVNFLFISEKKLYEMFCFL